MCNTATRVFQMLPLILMDAVRRQAHVLLPAGRVKRSAPRRKTLQVEEPLFFVDFLREPVVDQETGEVVEVGDAHLAACWVAFKVDVEGPYGHEAA